MPTISPPDIAYDTSENSYRPSWSEQRGYINSEHEQIFEATKHIPGFQDPADSEKLYEVAYHCGAIMLEIGVFGGRSAVVQLRGALAAHRERGGSPPQYYGLDTDPLAIRRTTKSLQSASLLEPAMLYHGSLVHFHRDIPIVPTMVFVDGDHTYESVWSDLRILSTFLGPHTPVFCHDYVGLTGVRRAVDEWIQRGAFEPMGLFAGSMLLRSSARTCRGRADTLSPKTFDHARRALLTRYLSAGETLAKGLRHCPVADLTRALRLELLAGASKHLLSGRGHWPWVNPDPTPLPEAMPDGSPWPRISIVTPTFNQGRYIEQTILSVANQDYPDVEHIVVDGGSTDETPAVLDRYANHFAHVVSEPDQGQSDAINKGFSRATGEILTWINSDDMLAPGALAAAAMAITGSDGRRAADGSTGADFVTGICRVFDRAWPDGKIVQQSLTSIPQGPMPLTELLDIERCWLAGRFWWQPDCLFTRDLWERAGAQVRLDWYYSMDYELWLRMAEAGARVRVIGRPICLYRAHEQQKTAETDGGGYRGELPKVAREFCKKRSLELPRGRAPTRRSLRIAVFSDIGFRFGAGIAHRRLAAGFAAAGHEVFPFAAANADDGQAANVTTSEVVGAIASCEPDLVLVGNLHGAQLDPIQATDMLGAIAERFETAFVLHDLWLLTGRCAYPGGCDRFDRGCDESCTCPGAYPALEPDRVERAWNAKRRVLALSDRLTLLANSRWTLDRARHALRLMDRPPAMDWITYGLDTGVFRPRDRAACRESLGLPDDRFIVMTSASSLADERKGLAILRDALALLDLPDLLVVSPGWLPARDQPPIPGMRAMGYIDDDKALAMLYAAADIFVGPSVREAFGQVFVESAACATPCIGFRVGGVPEAVWHGVGGLIADEITPESLADCIAQLHRDPALRRDLGAWGRIRAQSDFSLHAAHHRMHEALTATGVAERIGLHCKIDFSAPTSVPRPTPINPADPAYRVVSGLDPWESAVPQRSLGRFRWALGPTCVVEFPCPHEGSATLVIACRNDHTGQRLRIVVGGREACDLPVPVCADRDHMIRADVRVQRGLNRVELHHWKWTDDPGRPLANRIISINLIPR